MNAGINKALEQLQPALAADGFDLRLESVGPDNVVNIALEALPGACLDCLVPDDVLVRVLETAIKAEAPGVVKVRLNKYNFENQH